MVPIFASLLALGFAAGDSNSFCQPEAFDAENLGYFVGTYDVVGRDYWTGRPFTGRASITLSDTLSVTWRDAGGNVSGTARTERCGADKIRVLHLIFRERETDMDALCHFSSELDNYARITCQFERAKKGGVKKPGLLALFYRHGESPN
jgi:hypothetical protein